ncbi:hypothetical protein MCELHM10_02965 [Paracoccaceae bacterium]|jgi:hypothetical protein
MMRALLILPFALAACVSSEIPDSERSDGVLAGTPIEVDGTTLVAQQMTDWPSMIAPVSAETGETMIVQSGTEDTVIISGSPDSRDLAIKALAVFCDRPDITSAGFDTQYVYQEPESGDWWFNGFQCEG